MPFVTWGGVKAVFHDDARAQEANACDNALDNACRAAEDLRRRAAVPQRRIAAKDSKRGRRHADEAVRAHARRSALLRALVADQHAQQQSAQKVQADEDVGGKNVAAPMVPQRFG